MRKPPPASTRRGGQGAALQNERKDTRAAAAASGKAKHRDGRRWGPTSPTVGETGGPADPGITLLPKAGTWEAVVKRVGVGKARTEPRLGRSGLLSSDFAAEGYETALLTPTLRPPVGPGTRPPTAKTESARARGHQIGGR